MKLTYWFSLLTLGCLLNGCAAAYESVPARTTNLEGRWVLNVSQSDNVEQMLDERLERERAKLRKQMERYRRSRTIAGEPPLPPLGAEGVDVPAADRAARERVMRRREKESLLFRRMLAISPTLQIEQQGNSLDIRSAVESRRVTPGSETQVSLPEGQLADSRVGWSGEWLVIERRARRGPRVIERFRLIRKTDQLEYQMAWSGETELAGMRVRRIYDRAIGEPPPQNPDVGPVR